MLFLIDGSLTASRKRRPSWPLHRAEGLQLRFCPGWIRGASGLDTHLQERELLWGVWGEGMKGSGRPAAEHLVQERPAGSSRCTGRGRQLQLGPP